MCDVSAVTYLQGAGAVSSALGAASSAQAQKSSLLTSAAIADVNARMLESSAQQALAAGQRQEQAARINTANIKAAQRTGFAAHGVDLGSASAIEAQVSTDTMGEIDANTIHANAVRSAWGYRVQATNQANQAATSRAAGDAINPTVSAASTLLTSAGRVAESWYSLTRGGSGAVPAFTPATQNGDVRAGMRGWY